MDKHVQVFLYHQFYYCNSDQTIVDEKLAEPSDAGIMAQVPL